MHGKLIHFPLSICGGASILNAIKGNSLRFGQHGYKKQGVSAVDPGSLGLMLLFILFYLLATLMPEPAVAMVTLLQDMALILPWP